LFEVKSLITRFHSGIKEAIVARENYSFKKYQKEMMSKKKAEEKRQRKLEKKAKEAAPDPVQIVNDQPALE